MHMADALVSPAVAGTMYAASGLAAAISIKKVRLEDDPKKIPVMGVMGAFVFATQMLNFTIPGTGSSGHLCGSVLLTALLGPYAGFLSMIGVLLIQCLVFADGGILALGCNVWNMAFYGCMVGGFLLWRPLMKRQISKKRIAIVSILACMLTLQLGAFSVTVETLTSGVTELPFFVFLGAMQPIHLAIGLVEGLITAAVLCFVYETRPEMLWGTGLASEGEKKRRLSFGKTIAVLAVAAVICAGGISHLASSNPDGLEWSIEKLTGSTELDRSGAAYEQASKIQEKTAMLPDYALKNKENTGTSLSGIAGAGIVVVVCVGGCYALRLFRRKTVQKSKGSERKNRA